jgi:uncharacterized membrane protein YagU involved in acid resistance
MTALAHFGYGSAMGAIYGVITAQFARGSVWTGIGFGLLVWAGSYLGILPALGLLRSATRQNGRRNALMVAAHVVWGIALASAWNRLQESETRQS